MADASVIALLKDEILAIEAGQRESGVRQSENRNDSVKGAFEKIVALVNVSDRSERALRDRLARDGFPEGEIDDAVERAIRCGIIDDLRYADVLIRSRINQGKGSVGIERELREQGIEVDRLEGWPFNYGVNDESERHRALDYLKSHPSRSKNKREGAYRKLVQRGYSTSIAASVARIWAEA